MTSTADLCTFTSPSPDIDIIEADDSGQFFILTPRYNYVIH